MPQFLHLVSSEQALKAILQASPGRAVSGEIVDVQDSLGRIVYENVYSPVSLPEFARSARDGYAVRAVDTFGASDSMPGYLKMIGEVSMGAAPAFSLASGTCALIHTGGMLPEGADSVEMLENTQKVAISSPTVELEPPDDIEIEIFKPVASGENVIEVGEDVVAGSIAVNAGKQIKPADIGGCMALGIAELRVAIKPKVGIISTGDELVAPPNKPHSGQVMNINSFTLAALVEQFGGEPVHYGIVPDDLLLLQREANKAFQECDTVLITAGSSASARDMTVDAIQSLGKPGVLVHGINIRPGKPTILAVCNGKPVFGLPGNPVSCMVIARLFVIPVIAKMMGKTASPMTAIPAKLMANVPSQAGREDWQPVKLTSDGQDGYLAEPIFSKSNLIFSLSIASGLIKVDADATGLEVGDMVLVYPFWD